MVPPPFEAHVLHDMVRRGQSTVDGELDGGLQVLHCGFQDGAHELTRRQRAVLQDGDGTEVCGRSIQRIPQAGPILDIGGVGAGVDAFAAKLYGDRFDALGCARDQGDVESVTSESPGDSGPELCHRLRNNRHVRPGHHRHQRQPGEILREHTQS